MILHKGTVVRGLTTAATVWCSSGAGCLAAIGQYEELGVLTALIVFINVVFGPVDRLKENFRNSDEKTED